MTSLTSLRLHLKMKRLRAAAVGRKRGPVTISHAALLVLWHAQQGRCAYTKMPMGLSRGLNRDFDVTLDRIDPAGGYEPGNVALVTRRANLAKGALSLDQFVALCAAVTAQARRGRAGTIVGPLAAPRSPDAALVGRTSIVQLLRRVFAREGRC
jgi:hypothetical protein